MRNSHYPPPPPGSDLDPEHASLHTYMSEGGYEVTVEVNSFIQGQ